MFADTKGPWGVVAVSVWVASIYLCVVMLLAIPCFFLVSRTLGLAYLLFFVFLMYIPLWTPEWAKQLVEFSIQSGMEYFSVKILVEDEEELKPGRAYLLGLEPHSVMPVALPIVFNKTAKGLPKALQGCWKLGTSVAFRSPVVRHMWWWLGMRDVSKENISRLLGAGQSCALIPGGVREIQFMGPGKEVAYLSRRRGFVRMAIRFGAPLVPVFVFGQTAAYHYWKLGPPFLPTSLVNWIARASGFQPLYPWGRWFSPVPNKVPITVVIGSPIEVPHEDNPDVETVQKYLDIFKEKMGELYEKHKSAVGYDGVKLDII